MADAADEAGEYETGECLRFLWKHRQVPTAIEYGCLWDGWGSFGDQHHNFWKKMPENQPKNTACQTLNRVLVTWPQHKHLLINALETEAVT